MKHINHIKISLLTTAMLTCIGAPAFSQTMTTTQTTTHSQDGMTVSKSMHTEGVGVVGMHSSTVTQERPGYNNNAIVINFMDFDANHDNILSRAEVGRLLFRIYDTDGNSLLDIGEYKTRSIITVNPMETYKAISYDFNGDGIVESTNYTHTTFMQDTQLARFDENRNGLSANEFMGARFEYIDVNRNRFIDFNEWQGAYIPMMDLANRSKRNFNN